MWQMRKIRLWEKAGWIIIRSRETARKLGLYMEEERDMRYEKFQTTGQERIRLACALEGFFLTNECEEEKKTAYGQYLKRRIRPAMEALIREENVGKWSSWRVLAGLEQKNWRILSVLPEESESWRAWCG